LNRLQELRELVFLRTKSRTGADSNAKLPAHQIGRLVKYRDNASVTMPEP
jgi:hypothetical protein